MLEVFFVSCQLKAVSVTFTLSIILDSELPSDSWNISPHGPMALGTPEQASGHTGWIPCLADRRIDCMIASARRQACSSTIGWWEVHARIWISRVGLSIAHWARTWIMGIHDLDPSRIPTLHCPSHTALDKDPAYHVGSSWIFVHIYGWQDPFIFVFLAVQDSSISDIVGLSLGANYFPSVFLFKNFLVLICFSSVFLSTSYVRNVLFKEHNAYRMAAWSPWEGGGHPLSLGEWVGMV